jgi:hypothetical protein
MMPLLTELEMRFTPTSIDISLLWSEVGGQAIRVVSY